MKYKLREEVLVEEWQEGVVVFNVNNYEFLEFNEVGGMIIKTLDQGRSIEEIVELVTEEFEVEEERARNDILAFCKQLVVDGIVDEVEGKQN